ncbi:MAG: hypothetical protein LBS74_04365 [Oscillospiraceae bacterium]|jgi:uncharacterized protein YjfI (DUF2170 family)|nr:hypothetical protein [Oscillospiraceae bacterium]
MSETVINVNTLPQVLINLFHTEEFRVQQYEGSITILPVKSDDWHDLKGLLSQTSNVLVSEEFSKQKELEKELTPLLD